MKGPGKGKTNNPDGRPPGVPNKVTKELREIINDFLNNNIDKVKKDFDKLDPKDRVKLFIDLLQYSIPKFQSIHAEVETETSPHVIQLIRADGEVSGQISNSEAELKESEGIN